MTTTSKKYNAMIKLAKIPLLLIPFLLVFCLISMGLLMENIPHEKIYLLGYGKSKTGDYIYKYWQHGEAKKIGDDIVSVTSMAVVDKTVYVAGDEIIRSEDSQRAAKYWKNGEPYKLTDGTKHASAIAIAVVGQDVYVAGYEENAQENNKDTHKRKAKYWKNGVAYSLTDGSKDAVATAIAVVGEDVYIAGVEEGLGDGKQAIKYWKNGVAQNIRDGSREVSVKGIAVLNEDVYIVGHEVVLVGKKLTQIAKYWKNGEAHNLGNGKTHSTATSIMVHDKDVYITGSIGGKKEVATYWKNGISHSLTDGKINAEAQGIAIDGNDIYVVGSLEKSKDRTDAVCWKNGKEILKLEYCSFYAVAVGD